MIDTKGKQKKHHFLPDPFDTLNQNMERLCDLLEILVDSEAKEIKKARRKKEDNDELNEIAQKIYKS